MYFTNNAIFPLKKRITKDSYLGELVVHAIIGVVLGSIIGTAIRNYVDAKNEKEIIQQIRDGRLTEKEFVKSFKQEAIKAINERQTKFISTIQNDDVKNSASVEIYKLKNNISRSKSINDLIAAIPDSTRLSRMKYLFDKAKSMPLTIDCAAITVKHNRAIKRYIDRAVRKYVKLALLDAGVKGMKKGQHVKARNQEYLESLRGGSGHKPQAAKPSAPKPPVKKKGFNGKEFAKGAAAGAFGGLIGGGLHTAAFGRGKDGKVSKERKAGVVTGALGMAGLVTAGGLLARKKGWI